MKALNDDEIRPSGTLAGGVHVRPPSAEVARTRSLAVQPVRKRQSSQTAYNVPAPSMSMDGSASARITPVVADSNGETVERANVPPPSVERPASIDPVWPARPGYAPRPTTDRPAAP